MTVREAIAQMGTGPYLDGSSAKPGWTYQPIGDIYSEYADVPCHKPHAVRYDFLSIYLDKRMAWQFQRVCDLAAANGYYSALPCEEYYGYEADPKSVALCHALAGRFRQVHERIVDPQCIRNQPHDYNEPSVFLAMNCHMWWAKQGNADKIMAELGRRTSQVYFQTAGKHSGGLCTVDAFDSIDTERAYLEQYFKSVRFIRTTALHGGVRHLWHLGNT